MKNKRQELGKWGETIAAAFLARKGYVILERNVRTPYGEIDLVAQLKNPPDLDFNPMAGKSPPDLPDQALTIVFVEVRTRTTREFGLPEESIMETKRSHILAAAQSYLQEHPELEGDWRVDVVAILRPSTGRRPNIKHFEGALEA